MNKISVYKYFVLVISAILTTTLFQACATLPPADPKLAATLHEEAIRATALQNYSLALIRYSEAIRYNPGESQTYIQMAEVQETLQQFSEAAETWQLALDHIPAAHVDRELIHYRLGLLLARDKGEQRRARQNLEQVSDQSLRLDLEGMITLYAGDPDASLHLFNQALQAESDTDQKARIYYHAALAHLERGAIPDSSNALFNAVNNASSLALKQHIRIFFEQLQRSR